MGDSQGGEAAAIPLEPVARVHASRPVYIDCRVRCLASLGDWFVRTAVYR